MVGLVVGVVVGLSLALAAGWWLQRALDNGGWTDVVWTFATGAAGVACALWPLDGVAPGGRQWLVASLFALWALRLGGYLAVRVASHPEDVRYAHFRQEWGAAFQSRMFIFLQVQALAAVLLVVAVLAAARNPAPFPAVTDLLGAAILLIAVTGESVADRQLSAFRAAQRGRSGVCATGLWRWSRHPNYFFEWLGWLAWPVIALAPAGPGWLSVAAWLGPVFMYGLLVYGSGIPPLEARMVESRGDAHRDYQRRTAAFFPRPPRADAPPED